MKVINELHIPTAKVVVVRQSTKSLSELSSYRKGIEESGLNFKDILYVDLEATAKADLREAYQELLELCRSQGIHTVIDDSKGMSGKTFIRGYIFTSLFGKDTSLWKDLGVLYRDGIKWICGTRWNSIKRESSSNELVDSEFKFDSNKIERIEVNSIEDLKELAKEIKQSKLIYFDIETDRLNYAHKDAKILCLQFGVEQHPNRAWVVWYDKSDIKVEFKDKIYAFMQWVLKNKIMIAHNGAAFDIPWVCTHFKVNPMEVDQIDTMALAYIARNSTERALLGLKIHSFPALGSYDDELDHFKKEYCREHKLKLEEFSYDRIPKDILFTYSADDIIALRYVYDKFRKECEEHPAGNLYEKVWNGFYKDFTKLISAMEYTGIPFDIEGAKNKLKELEAQKEEIEDSISKDEHIKLTEKRLSKKKYDKDMLAYNKKIAERKAQGKEFKGKAPVAEPVKFNFGSNDHKSCLFFETLKLKSKNTTATGNPSTDTKTVDQFVKDNPKIEILSKFGSLAKLNKELSAFYYPYIQQAENNYDGRIRGFIRLNGTVSGRISQTDVNILQVPRESEFKKFLSFTKDSGKCIVGADYSNLEGNYSTILTGDKGFMEQRKYAGNDGHSYNAIVVYDELKHLDYKNPEHIKIVKDQYPKLRQEIKAFSFQCIYLASHYGIAYNLGIELDKAEEMWIKFWDSHKELMQFYEDGREFAKEHGYIELTGGLVLRTPNIDSHDEKVAKQEFRTMSNARIQSGAYFTHASMSRVLYRCKEVGIKEVYPTIAIHDAAYFECNIEDKDRVGKIIEEEMTKPFMENQLFLLEADAEWGYGLKLEQGMLS